MFASRTTTLLSSAMLLLLAGPLRADEGMWTFDNLPIQKIKTKYGVAPDQTWLDHVRLSAVRFPGGTGSFVSADGLVLTNHHVGHNWIQKVSGANQDYVKDGFVAFTRPQEIPVPGLVLSALMLMENVTDQIEKAVPKGASEMDAEKERKAKIAALIEEGEKKTGFKGEAVKLYQGGEIWIYYYKRFSDVRLVMAPEYDVAAFGKDWDNFSWQRYNLDMSFFRVYENGVPYHPPHHLAWSRTGVAFGDSTYVIGHPGRTERLNTYAQMCFNRDVALPARIATLDARRQDLHARAAKGERVSAEIMGTENSYKVCVGELAGFKDLEAMARIEKAEQVLKAKVMADPKLKAFAGDSWSRIEKALAETKPNSKLSPETNAIIAEHGARIARARFAVYGRETYPDATFTLRLSYGAVDTYPANGTLMQPFTTFAGMYDRAAAWGPKAENGSWALPPRWIEKQSALNLTTCFNFITNNDIVGGNSGSPVVNIKGELVGLAFDGNIESLSGRYYFDTARNRCLAVDARGILEALTKVYDAKAIVEEIQRTK